MSVLRPVKSGILIETRFEPFERSLLSPTTLSPPRTPSVLTGADYVGAGRVYPGWWCRVDQDMVYVPGHDQMDVPGHDQMDVPGHDQA